MTVRVSSSKFLGARVAIVSFLAVGVGPSSARSDPPSPPPLLSPTDASDVAPRTSLAGLPDQSNLSLLLTGIIRQQIPREYENTKEWGRQKAVWDGLHVQLDNGRLKTKRRWKQVNDGTWKMYRAWLIDPDQELAVNVGEIREIAPGKAGVSVESVARLGAFGRMSQWEHGIQLLSVSADAEAKVRLRIEAEFGSRVELSPWPPALALDVKATSADVVLEDFRLIRISDLHGPLVRELGDALHDVLQKELAERRPKLVEKINRQIEKNRSRFRLALPGTLPGVASAPESADQRSDVESSSGISPTAAESR